MARLPTTNKGKTFIIYTNLWIESGGKIDDFDAHLTIFNTGGNGLNQQVYIASGGELELGDEVGGIHGYRGVQILVDYYGHAAAALYWYNYGTMDLHSVTFDRTCSFNWYFYGNLEFADVQITGFRPVFKPTSTTFTNFWVNTMQRLGDGTDDQTITSMHFKQVTSYIGVIRGDVTWIDCTIPNVQYYDDRTQTHIFIDGNVEFSKINLGDGSSLYRKHTINVIVKDESTGALIEGATVIAKDVEGTQEFSVLTGADGRIAEQLVTRYKAETGIYLANGTEDCNFMTPHTFTVSKEGYADYEVPIDVNEPVYMTVALTTSPEVFVEIAGGTEYSRGETARIVALVTGKDGTFLEDSDADCNASIFNPSNDWNGGGEMTYFTNGTFYFDHSLAFDASTGVWIATVDCNTTASDNNLAYDSHAFHVPQWIPDINSSIENISIDNNAIAESVWDWSGAVNSLITDAFADAFWSYVGAIGRWVHGLI